jgi:inosine-uridine nucleoside N-ribohydrolase
MLVAAFLIVGRTPAASAAKPDPAPWIVDHDADFDDMAALSYLAEADRRGMIDVKLSTVALSGVSLEEGGSSHGLAHTRCLNHLLDWSGVETTDGNLTGRNEFPDSIVIPADDSIHDVLAENGGVLNGTDVCAESGAGSAVGGVPTEGQAASRIVARVLNSPQKVNLITFGPQTNVAQALDMARAAGNEAAFVRNVERVWMMGGSTVGGNLCCGLEFEFDNTQEFNVWVDPDATARVIRAFGAKATMIPLDATSAVPLTAAFRERLGDAVESGTTTAANIVYDIARHPNNAAGEQFGFAFWWDPLAAVAATFGDVVSYRNKTLMSVVTANGPSEGRTFVDPSSGTPVRYGTSASQRKFHDRFYGILTDTWNH